MSFTAAQQRIDAAQQVSNILGKLHTIHQFAVELRDARALYLAANDPTFNAVFETILNVAADRTEISGMIVDLTALVITDWESLHPGALMLTP